MTKPNVISQSAFFVPRRIGAQSGIFNFAMPVFAAEGGAGDEGTGGEDEAAAVAAAAAAAAKKGASPEDIEKLARDAARAKKALETSNKTVTDLQAKLKQFDGIDLDLQDAKAAAQCVANGGGIP